MNYCSYFLCHLKKTCIYGYQQWSPINTFERIFGESICGQGEGQQDTWYSSCIMMQPASHRWNKWYWGISGAKKSQHCFNTSEIRKATALCVITSLLPYSCGENYYIWQLRTWRRSGAWLWAEKDNILILQKIFLRSDWTINKYLNTSSLLFTLNFNHMSSWIAIYSF